MKNATHEAVEFGYRVFKIVARQAGLEPGALPTKVRWVDYGVTMLGINLELSLRGMTPIHDHTFNVYKRMYRDGLVVCPAVNVYTYGGELSESWVPLTDGNL